MFGSYLYKYTIGKVGFWFGLPLFIVGYLYISGTCSIIIFDGIYGFSLQNMTNPIYIITHITDKIIYVLYHYESAPLLYQAKLLACIVIPLFIFRLIKGPVLFLYWILSFPFRSKRTVLTTKQLIKQQERQFKDDLKDQLKAEIIKEMKEEVHQAAEEIKQKQQEKNYQKMGFDLPGIRRSSTSKTQNKGKKEYDS